MGGKRLGTSYGCNSLYFACRAGLVEFTVKITKESERLDTIAGKIYGSGHLWWIIAAASGIGWGMQVPPGTVLRIPSRLEDVEMYVG